MSSEHEHELDASARNSDEAPRNVAVEKALRWVGPPDTMVTYVRRDRPGEGMRTE